MPLDFSLNEIVIGALAICVLLLAIGMILEERRIKRILKGKSGCDLEDSFKSIEKSYEEMRNFRKELNKYLQSVEDRLQRSVQAVETTRFNPWKGNGEGGNQSFASALISEKGDGVVVSSLSVRDRVSIFAKPIEKGRSNYELSNEEKAVLEKAMKKISN